MKPSTGHPPTAFGREQTETLGQQIGRVLTERGWTLTAAESCTGGLVCRIITSVAGASAYFDRGFVTYSNRAKVEQLGVPENLLRAHGAVSAPVAARMAAGARQAAGANLSVAITGIAGPSGGSPDKPVGTVFIACTGPLGTVVEKHRFHGSRRNIQEQAAAAALGLIWGVLIR